MTEFECRKSESSYWYNKANDLHLAASVLWKCMSAGSSDEVKIKLGLDCSGRLDVALPPVWRMLCGMSIELLLKTSTVAKGNVPKPIHHLDQLAADAGANYNNHQLKLLKILSQTIIWHGKYPIPRSESDWENLVTLETEMLFDKEPLRDTGLDAYVHNDALFWNSYCELWRIAFDAMRNNVDWLRDA